MQTVRTQRALFSAMNDDATTTVYIAANITFNITWPMQGVAVTTAKTVLGDRTACGESAPTAPHRL
jgi:hypothetical protein